MQQDNNMKETRREIVFNKYERIGAYHWKQCSYNLKTVNVHTKARYKIVINCVAEFFNSTPVTALEVGCGDGALTASIHKLGHQVYGVDTNSEGIRFAKEKFREKNLTGEFYIIDGYNYPFEDNFFEFVVCADVIEHVQKPLQMLEEIHRVLKKGGILIISTPIKIQNLPISKNHVQEWTIDDFEDFCATVFGKPTKRIISHPLSCYRLYTSKNNYIRKIARLLINILSLFGINVFLKTSKKSLSRYQMQTLVLEKVN